MSEETQIYYDKGEGVYWYINKYDMPAFFAYPEIYDKMPPEEQAMIDKAIERSFPRDE
jgi:hypothetical protein